MADKVPFDILQRSIIIGSTTPLALTVNSLEVGDHILLLYATTRPPVWLVKLTVALNALRTRRTFRLQEVPEGRKWWRMK